MFSHIVFPLQSVFLADIHGADRECSFAGCTNRAKSRGVCVRHDAKFKVKLCSNKGCTNHAKIGGLCCRHGGAKLCSSEGCTNQAIRRGVCVRHGAKLTRGRVGKFVICGSSSIN